MLAERFLVTGALGCIGAWTVKRMINEGVPVWTYDLPGDPHRLRLIMGDAALEQVQFIDGDITDFSAFERAVIDNGISHIVHLAALQIPFVRADPVLGARVNVVGTAVVLETVKRHTAQVRGLAYASSFGVYGSADQYPPGPLAHDAPAHPPTLYGVYKQANEGMARIYWQEHGVRSIGLRPFVVYGPGRDQGMTSSPTKAMLAAAAGRPFHIPYSGRIVYQLADDMAGLFIRAARAEQDGAEVYTPGGTAADMQEIVTLIERAAPDAAGTITVDPQPLGTFREIDETGLVQALGATRWTPLADGVQRTIETFRAAARAGTINVDRALA